MLIQTNQPRPTEEMVHQLGHGLATHLVAEKEKSELPELAAAQSFQENVVAKQNQVGMRGMDGLGQCVARMDVGIYLRIRRKHAAEIAADPRKFWLVTAPALYPEMGLKPRYVPKAGMPLHRRFKF